LGQGLLDLPAHRDRRLALPFKQAQAIPKADDFSIFVRGHASLEQKETSRYE
jgi:hypothetical protein